jgi:chromosome segregation ATPase
VCVGEVEELQGRLKASRYRVMDLEKEVSSLQVTNEGLEKVVHELSCECDKLKLENNTICGQLSEREEEISELHQKLNARMNDYVILQQELQEKSSQLSLTQLRVQQVCSLPFII